MRKSLAIFGIFILLLIIIFYPLPEKHKFDLNESILLRFNSYVYGGNIEIITIYNNGTVEYITQFGETINAKLHDEDLQKLKDLINKKEYQLKKRSLWDEFSEVKTSEGNLDTTSVLINNNGKTILINKNQVLYDIIAKIPNESVVLE